ncbi:MAG: nuclear transport factor 2 family protein [Acidobacteriota bacterium]|nr:nuclear transport factor 2 family protein [Acidobacteriota bacterium]
MRTTVKLLLVILLVGCTTTSNRPSSSNAQQIRSLYDAFGRGDIPTVLGALDPNVEWIEPENTIFGDRNTFRGPKAVAEGVFMRIPQDWNNFRLTIDRLIDGGDTVAVQGRYNATSKSTGLPLNAQYVHVWDIRDGKIVRLQVYTDTAQFIRVSGMR